MIKYEASCITEPFDEVIIRPWKGRHDGTYVEINTTEGGGAVILSDADLMKLRDKLNEALPLES